MNRKEQIAAITDRDREVLEAVESYEEWLRPMDIGGSDGSHHGKTLAKLWRKGLIKRGARNTITNFFLGGDQHQASSYCYKTIVPEMKRAEELMDQIFGKKP